MRTKLNSIKVPLIWIAVILAVAALRETRTVTMPLGVGLFLAVLAWPLEKRLETRMPAALSLTLTSLVFVAVVAAFVATLVFCATAIAEKAADYQDLLVRQFARAKAWVQAHGLPAEYLELDPAATLGRAISVLLDFATGLYSLLGQLVLAAGYFFLALVEMRSLRLRSASQVTGFLPDLFAAGREVLASTQRFMLTRTVIGLAMGLLTTLYALTIGLDFALVWGISAFLLNYVPLFGAAVAVMLPTLLALIQPEAAWLAPATFVGLGAIHITLGNYVDPWMQGKYLALSPLVLLFSITFWGWIWGVAGVLMSVPLTAAIVIACKHSEQTRWLAQLLTHEPGEHRRNSVPGQPAPASRRLEGV